MYSNAENHQLCVSLELSINALLPGFKLCNSSTTDVFSPLPSLLAIRAVPFR